MSARRPARGYTALVLAGRRHGEDPLAEAAGAPHRALVDIHGTPMLERVLRVLIATPSIGQIIVSIDTPRLLDRFPGIAAMRDGAARVAIVQATESPSLSVLEILDDGAGDQPLLVTTADHALLTVEMVEHFLGEAESRGGDVALGLVASQVLRERFPESKRTYLPFKDERYSGANLFAFQTPRARRAVEFWQRAESHRKRPWRLVATFGMRPLALFLLRRLSLDEAMAEVSSVLDTRVTAIVMPQAEAAVDVDKPSDLDLVRLVLAEDPSPEETTDDGVPDEGRDGVPDEGREGVTEWPDQDEAQNDREPSATKPPLPAS